MTLSYMPACKGFNISHSRTASATHLPSVSLVRDHPQSALGGCPSPTSARVTRAPGLHDTSCPTRPVLNTPLPSVPLACTTRPALTHNTHLLSVPLAGTTRPALTCRPCPWSVMTRNRPWRCSSNTRRRQRTMDLRSCKWSKDRYLNVSIDVDGTCIMTTMWWLWWSAVHCLYERAYIHLPYEDTAAAAHNLAQPILPAGGTRKTRETV